MYVDGQLANQCGRSLTLIVNGDVEMLYTEKMAAADILKHVDSKMCVSRHVLISAPPRLLSARVNRDTTLTVG